MQVTPDRIVATVREYLPEISSEQQREQMTAKLAADAELLGDGKLAAAECPVPPPYRPELDRDGRLADYFSHFTGVWAAEIGELVAGHPVLAPDNTVLADFLGGQTGLVASSMVRTMLEELHRRRSAGLLAGSTPQQRYASFREWTNSDAGHAELLARYPHVFSFARNRLRAAADHLARILSEVERYRDSIADRLPGISGDALVSSVVLGQGDTHRGGRTVAGIQFSDGTRVVYKPRPMEGEAGYNDLIAWVNERIGCRLPTIRVLPTAEGGFVQHVTAVRTPADEERYFRQIGQLTAILFLLRASDIHFENVITCADGPIVIDTETLLTPRLRQETAAAQRSGDEVAARRIQESVAGIGILPTVLRARGDERGMDVGVIGYDQGQQNPFRSLVIRRPGRDDMYVELAGTDMAGESANLSVHQATGLSVRAQRDLIKAECRRVLDYVGAHRDDAIAAVEKHLGDGRFRFVRVATVFYAQLLRMATHPSAFADPFVRAAVLNRGILLGDAAPAVTDDEYRQLAGGDVPYFTHDLRTGALLADGGVVLENAFERPGLDAVRRRIAGLDQSVIDEQLHMIDLSFVNKLPPAHELTGFAPVLGGAGQAVPAAVPGRPRLLAEAARIGDALVATMILGEDEPASVSWIAPQILASDDEQWTPGTPGSDLYGGAAGIVLALAGLARETGDIRYRDAALRVLEPIEAKFCDGFDTGARLATGGMAGLGGTIYAVATARRLLDLPGRTGPGRLAAMLASGVKTRRRPPQPDYDIEIIGGMAGALAVVLALHRHAVSDDDRREAAAAVHAVAAEELATIGDRSSDGWRVTGHTGYAHGAMGIASVLTEYGWTFDNPTARERGALMLRAVLDAYDESDGDWSRTWDGPQRSYAWCHGAPGMLLGCLAAIRHDPASVPMDALSRLAELSARRGLGNNPSYCHGDLGTVEVLTLAEREVPGLLDRWRLDDLYPRVFTQVVERYEQRFDTKYSYSNSLMVGQSGAAWSILHHLDPETYPSILRLG